MDARQLLTNPIDYPIEIRISSTADVNAKDEAGGYSRAARDCRESRGYLPVRPGCGTQRGTSGVTRTRRLRWTIDPDRANLAGITNMDVANSTTSGMSGTTSALCRRARSRSRSWARLRMGRAVAAFPISRICMSMDRRDNTKIPLVQISNIDHGPDHRAYRSPGTIPYH